MGVGAFRITVRHRKIEQQRTEGIPKDKRNCPFGIAKRGLIVRTAEPETRNIAYIKV